MNDADLVTLALHFQAKSDDLSATAIIVQMRTRKACVLSDDVRSFITGFALAQTLP